MVEKYPVLLEAFLRAKERTFNLEFNASRALKLGRFITAGGLAGLVLYVGHEVCVSPRLPSLEPDNSMDSFYCGLSAIMPASFMHMNVIDFYSSNPL